MHTYSNVLQCTVRSVHNVLTHQTLFYQYTATRQRQQQQQNTLGLILFMLNSIIGGCLVKCMHVALSLYVCVYWISLTYNSIKRFDTVSIYPWS